MVVLLKMTMRAIQFGIICLASVSVAQDEPERIEIDFSSPQVDNQFSTDNPNYKPRAASFYERKYLPSAAAFLIEVCEVDPELHPYLLEILRAFLYERADAYVRGDGAISADTLAEIVARMEDRLQGIITVEQWKKYPAWKEDGAGKNGFDFLLVTHPRVDRLPEKKSREQGADGQSATAVSSEAP